MPAAATFVVGTIRMTTPELWRDEISSWSAASRSPGQILHLLGHTDAVLGGYYLLLHGWGAIAGWSPLALRLPSAAAMAGAAAFTALVARRLMGSAGAGVAAGLLFAVLPVVSRFAQEARPYALTVLASVLSVWLLLRVLDRPTWPGWLAYAAAVWFTGVFSLVALVGLVGHAVMVLSRNKNRRRVLLGWLAAATAATVALVPLAVAGSRQAGQQINWIPRPTAENVLQFGPHLFHGVAIAVVVLAVAVVALVRQPRLALLLLALALLPILLVLAVSSFGSTSFWLPRYLIFTIPYWCVLAVVAAHRLPYPAVVVLVVVVAACGLPAQVALRDPLAHEGPGYPSSAPSGLPGISYRGAADIIAQQFEPGDGVIGAHGRTDFMIDAALAYYLPGKVRPRDVFVLRTAADNGSFLPSASPHPTPAAIPQRRLWLATIGKAKSAARYLTPTERTFLARYYIVRRTYQPAPDTVVQLLVRR